MPHLAHGLSHGCRCTLFKHLQTFFVSGAELLPVSARALPVLVKDAAKHPADALANPLLPAPTTGPCRAARASWPRWSRRRRHSRRRRQSSRPRWRTATAASRRCRRRRSCRWVVVEGVTGALAPQAGDATRSAGPANAGWQPRLEWRIGVVLAWCPSTWALIKPFRTGAGAAQGHGHIFSTPNLPQLALNRPGAR